MHAARALLLLSVGWIAPALALAASPIDGTWMAVKDKTPDPGSLVQFKVERHQVSVTTPGGLSYTARLDGSDTPISGDLNITSVSVKMPAKHVLVETTRSHGKPWRVWRMEVDEGGNTARVTWKGPRGDKDAGSYQMVKQ